MAFGAFIRPPGRTITFLRAMHTSAPIPEGYGTYARPASEREAEIISRIGAVRASVTRASELSQSHGWRTGEPRLVAVSKLHPPSAIMAAHTRCHQTHFGENYVQELVDKARVLPPSIQWHFIGALQSNKAKALAAVPNLYAVETLESSKTADHLEKYLAQHPQDRSTPLRVFIQVNTSGESNKAGLPPLAKGSDSADSPVASLAKHLITSCPHLLFAGLMTIGSFAHSRAAEADLVTAKSDPQAARKAIVDANPDFATLIDTRARLVQVLRADGQVRSAASEAYASVFSSSDPTGGLELSMGMSNDLDVAIMAGSSNVRVGTECFGTRPSTRQEAMAAMEHELNPSRTR